MSSTCREFWLAYNAHKAQVSVGRDKLKKPYDSSRFGIASEVEKRDLNLISQTAAIYIAIRGRNCLQKLNPHHYLFI